MKVDGPEQLPDTLENAKFTSMAWTHDNKGLFYNVRTTGNFFIIEGFKDVQKCFPTSFWGSFFFLQKKILPRELKFCWLTCSLNLLKTLPCEMGGLLLMTREQKKNNMR